MTRRRAPKVAAWKVALIGGIVGTLPDLDAFIDFGDAISNMIRHRAESHGLFYLTLVTPPIAYLVMRLLGGAGQFVRWCVAVWLILITHVGLDLLTIYGTQFAQPFSSTPFGIGSMFVIDPFYTLPLLLGLLMSVVSRSQTAGRWNAWGLVVSSAYVVWGLAVHQHVSQLAAKAPPVNDPSLRMVVTAAPLNTVLWRAVAETPDHYYEGWYSLLDAQPTFSWKAYPRPGALIDQHRDHRDVARMAAFTHGFFTLEQVGDTLFLTDLRLGLEPFYSFRFDLGNPADPTPSPSQRVGVRPDLKTGLPWLWRRMLGDPTPLADALKS